MIEITLGNFGLTFSSLTVLFGTNFQKAVIYGSLTQRKKDCAFLVLFKCYLNL